MKGQSLFDGKNRKNTSKCCLQIFYPVYDNIEKFEHYGSFCHQNPFPFDVISFKLICFQLKYLGPVVQS